MASKSEKRNTRNTHRNRRCHGGIGRNECITMTGDARKSTLPRATRAGDHLRYPKRSVESTRRTKTSDFSGERCSSHTTTGRV